MLLSRYNNIEFINRLSWTDGIEIINKALDKRNEQRDWDLYCSVYPDMDKKTFIPFEKFRGKKQQITHRVKKQLTGQEIIEKAEELRKLHQGTHEGVAKEDCKRG